MGATENLKEALRLYMIENEIDFMGITASLSHDFKNIIIVVHQDIEDETDDDFDDLDNLLNDFDISLN